MFSKVPTHIGGEAAGAPRVFHFGRPKNAGDVVLSLGMPGGHPGRERPPGSGVPRCRPGRGGKRAAKNARDVFLSLGIPWGDSAANKRCDQSVGSRVAVTRGLQQPLPGGWLERRPWDRRGGELPGGFGCQRTVRSDPGAVGGVKAGRYGGFTAATAGGIVGEKTLGQAVGTSVAFPGGLHVSFAPFCVPGGAQVGAGKAQKMIYTCFLGPQVTAGAFLCR